jgi:hypothetical protein
MPGTIHQADDDIAARARALLDAWERAQTEPPGARALTLLAAGKGARREELEVLTVGARDRRRLELRRELFGAALDAVVSCPRCAEPVELAFGVDDILVGPGELSPAPVAVETATGPVSVRIPTAGDLVAAHAHGDADAALATLLERVVLAAGDGPLTPDAIDQIGTALAAADPQSDVSFDVTCPACGEAFVAPFDIVDFVWREFGGWAARLLSDVHTLARAYGWREGDTLALSPARRRFYLEAVGA